jgi:hypothetical protein
MYSGVQRLTVSQLGQSILRVQCLNLRHLGTLVRMINGSAWQGGGREEGPPVIPTSNIV